MDDLTERTGYLSRLEDLARQASAAVPADAPAATRGEALLRWVHERVLTGGYQSEQTDLSVLLDTGKFNCVSSAVLYNILALELDLDARAIEVPDHAFSIVYDGADHMDVETTTADGFNPARERIAAFEELTGFRYIPQSDKANRREIGAAGLAALIYYNHAVADLQAGRYREALVANFRAMSLDQEFVSAVKNAIAALANWSAELAQQGDWERGVEIAGLGARLAPSDAGIAHNHEALWTQWAMSRIDAGDADGAIATLERAAVVLPDRGFEEMQAMAFLRPGEQLAEQGSFAAALETTEPGLRSIAAAGARGARFLASRRLSALGKRRNRAWRLQAGRRCPAEGSAVLPRRLVARPHLGVPGAGMDLYTGLRRGAGSARDAPHAV